MARRKKKQPNMTAESEIPRVNEIVKERELLLTKVMSMCNRPAGSDLDLEFTQIQGGTHKRVTMKLPPWMFERIRTQLRDQYDNMGASLRVYGVEPKP